ncbi:MAG: hypothetical protein JW910_16090 [Anaerolineae bacterium]|nr:hypothetical protein [Anaerolineae bacterium]
MLDLLCFGFVAVGIEDVGVTQTDLSQGVTVISPASLPWSHGLLMSIVWSVVAAVIAYLLSRNRWTSSAIGLAVFSHWLLDFIVHPAELPLLLAGSPEVGLGLWTSGPGLIASAILEVVLLAGGIAIYLFYRRQAASRALEPART